MIVAGHDIDSAFVFVILLGLGLLYVQSANGKGWMD